jgi:hypothetical protein
MRSHKAWTNATWTHRVDHAGGRHRAGGAPAEPLVCTGCGARWLHRRWVGAAQAARPNAEPARPPHRTLCPACRQAVTGVPGGFVVLEGAFLSAHRAGIESLIRNEARRAAEDNPLARVLRATTDEAGRLVVCTTTAHLALRIGRALRRAAGGRVRYDFSHENPLARVQWRRD